jgi:plastocyanin
VRYLYAPKRLVIEAGTTVEWTNRDEMVHTVSADDGSWDSGAIRPGESWRATFTEPGVYPFHCGPHPFMKGVVVVR